MSFCIYPDPLWSAPALSCVAKCQFFGTLGFARSRRNFMVRGSWFVVCAWEADQEERKTVRPTWRMPCLPHEEASLCNLLFVGSSSHYSGRVRSTFTKKMVFSYLKVVSVFDSWTLCHTDGLYLHLCFSEYYPPTHPVRLSSRCGHQQAASPLSWISDQAAAGLQWGSRWEYWIKDEITPPALL